MRFELIDAAKKEFPVQRLCKVLDVSPSGYFAWKGRPACRRQRDDMVLLAHVRSAFTLSNETYGSPRMVHELRDNGLSIGRRRVAAVTIARKLELAWPNVETKCSSSAPRDEVWMTTARGNPKLKVGAFGRGINVVELLGDRSPVDQTG